MKRVLAAIVSVVCVTSICFAGVLRQETIYDANGSSAIVVATGSTVYTHSFETARGSTWGLESLFESGDAANINMTVQMENSNVRPATEGVTHAKWSIPVGASDIYTASTANTTQYKTITVGPWKYGRFKLINLNTASASTCTLTVNEVQN